MLQEPIRTKVISALVAKGMKPSRDGKYLRGACPECGGKSDFWTWADDPRNIQCSRLEHCGYEATYAQLFPELLQDISKQYAATPDEPNKAACFYLQAVRGLPVEKINGWYEQGKFSHYYADKATATVLFKLGNGATFERLIDTVNIKEKSGYIKRHAGKHFTGDYSGYWWAPPTLDILENDTVYLVEGIIDAIALNVNGFKSVAIITCKAWPELSIKPHFGKGVHWIVALDNDKAGTGSILKHIKRLEALKEHASAAISSTSRKAKLDWADLHKEGKLKAEDMKRYRLNGSILTAKTYQEKSFYTFEALGKRAYFVIEHRNAMYAVKVDMAELAKQPSIVAGTEQAKLKAKMDGFNSSSKINKVATFGAEYLYYQMPEVGDEGQYYLRISPENGAPPSAMSFKVSDVTTPASFKNKAARAPGALFTGGAKDLDYLYTHWNAEVVKKVTTLDYVGYDIEQKAYVFGDFAVQNGQVIKLNKDDYFDLAKTGIKSTLKVNQRLTTRAPAPFIDDYITAYGTKGVIALAWFIGSLFVMQIRDRLEDYPFIEIWGKPGTGKSQMVNFLYKLTGRDNESFNPTISRAAGISRKLAQFSNLFIGFEETDNETKTHFTKFNWNEWKSLFSGYINRVRGVNTGGNETDEPVFKSALCITQNMPVDAEDAIRSRLISMVFDHSHHTRAGYDASTRLSGLTTLDVSGFLLQTLCKESAILEHFFAKFTDYMTDLNGNQALTTYRIKQTHAQMLALCDCLPLVIEGISGTAIMAAKTSIIEMAVNLEASLRRDHPVIEAFWELYEHYNIAAKIHANDEDGAPRLNNCGQKGVIWINLEQFKDAIAKVAPQRANEVDIPLLKKHLANSTRPQFLEKGRAEHSVILKRTVRMWVFKEGGK